MLIARMLRREGYDVLETADGESAVQLAKGPERIDLLLTDVVMPGMSGSALATRVKELRPDIKIIYMSGYTHDMIERHGVFEPGTAFLQKPFTARALGRAVHDVESRRQASRGEKRAEGTRVLDDDVAGGELLHPVDDVAPLVERGSDRRRHIAKWRHDAGPVQAGSGCRDEGDVVSAAVEAVAEQRDHVLDATVGGRRDRDPGRGEYPHVERPALRPLAPSGSRVPVHGASRAGGNVRPDPSIPFHAGSFLLERATHEAGRRPAPAQRPGRRPPGSGSRGRARRAQMLLRIAMGYREAVRSPCPISWWTAGDS